MSSYGFPDIVGFYDMLYGTAGVDYGGICVFQFGAAASIVGTGGNPSFTMDDFLSIYPKFFGPVSILVGDTTTGSNVINNIATAGLLRGQLISAPGVIPGSTVINAVGNNSITISSNALVTGTGSTFNSYPSPFMPIVAILQYLILANASLIYTRYQEAWYMCMCYFIAHFCTLYMRSESGTPNITAAQVAASGLTKGIIVQRAAGDVSAGSKIVEGYEQWGAWGETQYGELFMTTARATNAGPIWVG